MAENRWRISVLDYTIIHVSGISFPRNRVNLVLHVAEKYAAIFFVLLVLESGLKMSTPFYYLTTMAICEYHDFSPQLKPPSSSCCNHASDVPEVAS